MTITEGFQTLQGIKQELYDSISDQDSSFPTDTPFEDYPQAIQTIVNVPTPGIELYDSTKTYSQNKVVLNVANNVVKFYQSLSDNNTSALTDNTKWREILVNLDLSNLSSTGESHFQAPITGAASSIATSDLTASKALVSDASGKVAASSVTSTELGYVSGVTSAIQTQLSNKQETLVSGTNIKTVNGSTVLGSGDLTIDTGANADLSNLSSTGEAKIKSNIQLVDALPAQPETGVLYCIPEA